MQIKEIKRSNFIICRFIVINCTKRMLVRIDKKRRDCYHKFVIYELNLDIFLEVS